MLALFLFPGDSIRIMLSSLFNCITGRFDDKSYQVIEFRIFLVSSSFALKTKVTKAKQAREGSSLSEVTQLRTL